MGKQKAKLSIMNSTDVTANMLVLTHLQCCPIFNQIVSDELSYLFLNWCYFCFMDLWQWKICLHSYIKVGNVHHGITKTSGYIDVDLTCQVH